MSVLYLLEADAQTFEEFFIYSVPRSIEGAIRQVFIPPANTKDSIRYHLYTRSNPKEACFIEPTPAEFDHCPFDPNLDTKILIHGFVVTVNTEKHFELIKDALLKHGSYNVILVDWSRYNGHPYLLAVLNAIPVGKKIAEFIDFMNKHTEARYSSFHVIGHSLGAHISGIVGKHSNNLARITGLDPAGPLYELDSREHQLYYTDAEFVDVIHSSDELTGKGLGKFEPMGHMDFYPNGGQVQPACERAKEADAFGDIITKQTSKLFDTALCKCADLTRCTCPKDKEVLVLERQFLLDKRGPRIGRIGSVDIPVTKGMIKRAERSCKRLRPKISLSESSYSNAVSHSLSNDSQHCGAGDDVAGVENKAEDNFVKDDMFTKSRGKTYKPKLDLTETVIIAQRYNISERAFAYITSAVLHAVLKAGIISSGQSSDITSALIVDKNKIRHEKLKVARNLKQRSTDDDPIKSLYFDGRKDETKIQTGIFREVHIFLVADPNFQYVGHVNPSSGSAHEETTVIFEYITSQLKGGFDEVDVLG
ncbi:Hepatic triacylglycerol lipase [Araneus ventricosus]|uniref:Hepatic triacylglycerol lipase n=1 Tax=Araneus ventricosus TaxID=182803 RepID=A0A4Y2MSW6_ARAVE|nr:Hepatic triacylglycerol lipase [Araneus ventricosus]